MPEQDNMTTEDQNTRSAEAFEAFRKAQEEIAATGVAKKARGQYKNRYATIEDLLAAILPILTKHDLVLVQEMFHEDKAGNLLTTRVRHTNGRTIATSSAKIIWQEDGDCQHFMSGVTYMRRYQLTALLGVPEADDDGGGASPKWTPPARTKTQAARYREKAPPPPKASDDLGEKLKHAVASQLKKEHLRPFVMGAIGRVQDDDYPLTNKESRFLLLLLEHDIHDVDELDSQVFNYNIRAPGQEPVYKKPMTDIERVAFANALTQVADA